GSGGEGDTRDRAARAAVDIGIEPVWSAAGGGAGIAVCVRVAFCTGGADAGAAGLSRKFPAFAAVRAAVCGGGGECVRRGDGCGGAADFYLRTAGVHEYGARC